MEGMQQESAANKEIYGLFKAQGELPLNRAIHKAIQFSEELQKRSSALDNEVDRTHINDLLREPSPPTEQKRKFPCASLTRETSPQSSTFSQDGGDSNTAKATTL
ncbi:uncharacterized protein N7443_008394 [Penicillium atrosanguineum]|uniref:uncharacterized protein n=1 Tax=Penicillium atrosanguineum TaxID=1132637 RepID=UPI00239DF62C|nr:uncharacterized protein N7443_008394 [Penicillium atrosanguineum]KAJ5292441.1 hypothetical protein N7443_008394 [Penicillium atrosanguineum]